uniref:Sphingomyelin phosphodiesterase 4 n=1 Tax=Salarias fasciatus TaxID=181472 RepID=A0A672FXR3_SALFA
IKSDSQSDSQQPPPLARAVLNSVFIPPGGGKESPRMAAPALQQPSFLLANLKADCGTKPLLQRCQDLVKVIDEYPELHPSYPGSWRAVFGSLDVVLGRLEPARSNLSRACPLSSSGPVMKLVYKLQAEDYKYEIPVTTLPGPVKACIQEASLPDCPLFHNKLQFPPGRPADPFEFFMFNFAYCLISPKVSEDDHQGGSTDSAYFVLLDTYLKYFSCPPRAACLHRRSPTPEARSAAPSPRGLLTGRPASPPAGRLTSGRRDAQSVPSPSPSCPQMVVEVWLHHYSLDMYQKLQSPQVKEPFSPSEEHVLVVRLLVKHLHAFSSSLKAEPGPAPTPPPAHPHPGPLEEFKRVVVQRFVQQKLYLFLQHCFGHWPLDASFRAVTTSSRGDTPGTRAESFVHENLLLYTKLFQVFLNRAVRTDLVNAKNALMVFRVAKVFSQPNLAEMIQKGEQLFLEPEHVLHHRQPRGYLTPGQGGSYLSSRQRAVPDMVFRVKSHVYSLEGQDCQYQQMFGSELRGGVLKLVQIIAQARQTAKRISDQSSEAASSGSFLSWFGLGSADAGGTFSGAEPEETGECLKKTHEFLDRALENLSQIFKLNQGHLNQVLSNLGSSQDDGNCRQLPDCVQGEDGLVLTELGRRQIINGLRRFEVQYQGDPELQPIRSYESALLVRLLYRTSSLLNDRFGGHMTALCSRPDFLGRLGRYYLTDVAGGARLRRSPASRYTAEQSRRPRLSLRPLASYRTLLLLLLFYLLGALLSLGPGCSTLLLLAAALLYGLFAALFADKLKAA